MVWLFYGWSFFGLYMMLIVRNMLSVLLSRFLIVLFGFI